MLVKAILHKIADFSPLDNNIFLYYIWALVIGLKLNIQQLIGRHTT
jgi:hypothetical protein